MRLFEPFRAARSGTRSPGSGHGVLLCYGSCSPPPAVADAVEHNATRAPRASFRRGSGGRAPRRRECGGTTDTARGAPARRRAQRRRERRATATAPSERLRQRLHAEGSSSRGSTARAESEPPPRKRRPSVLPPRRGGPTETSPGAPARRRIQRRRERRATATAEKRATAGKRGLVHVHRTVRRLMLPCLRPVAARVERAGFRRERGCCVGHCCRWRQLERRGIRQGDPRRPAGRRQRLPTL